VSERTDFLNVLVPPSAGGFLNLRAFNDRREDLYPQQAFVKADAPDREQQVSEFVDRVMLAGYDVYVGVAERAVPDGKKVSCSTLRALFIDIDVDKAGLDWGVTIAKVLTFKPAPTIIINSGGGLHVYWVLGTPINLRAEGEIQKTESLLRRLAAALGGDPAATDVSRVLRVPSTLNYKYTPFRAVEVVHFAPEIRL
jgi:RepB DNA-primase from phage plasmid